jgi:rhodanese-related sulfurtransferase
MSDFILGKSKIIDLRNRNEFLNNHMYGAFNIPYDELLNNYRKYLNKSELYYLYCKTNKLSRRMSMILNYLGYNTKVLD